LVDFAHPDLAQDYKDSEEYYNYSFESIQKIFVTLLIMITTNNTPDLALGDPRHRTLYGFFYVFISLFNLVLESGLILAIINQLYHQVFQEEIENVAKLGQLTDVQWQLIE
jgi:hypothetical protein